MDRYNLLLNAVKRTKEIMNKDFNNYKINPSAIHYNRMIYSMEQYQLAVNNLRNYKETKED